MSSRLRGALEKKLFFLLLVLLPANLAKHFFFDFAYVTGSLVDYLLPTIYLTDLIVLALLFLWVKREGRLFFPSSLLVRGLLLWSLAIAVSVFWSQRPLPAAYRLLKLFEAALLTLYVRENIDLRSDMKWLVQGLALGVFWQSLLVLGQWWQQRSLFGYWFLGEQPFNSAQVGIARIDFLGQVRVRPYGTFPHPNVLGGFFAVILPWLFWTATSRKSTKPRRAFLTVTLILGVTALFLSFSRTALLSGLLALFLVAAYRILQWAQRRRPNFVVASFLLLLMPSFFYLGASFLRITTLTEGLSVRRRLYLNQVARAVVSERPLVGVGLNNFAAALPDYGAVPGPTRFLQPVHNIYLLIASEAGVVSLAVFLAMFTLVIYFLFKNVFWRDDVSWLLLVTLTQLGLLGLFDHYLLTLQQGVLLLFLFLGLGFRRVYESSNFRGTSKDLTVLPEISLAVES